MTVKYTKWLMLAGMAILLMTMGCKQMGSIEPDGSDVGIAATSSLPIQYNPGGSWFTYFYYMPGVGTAVSPVQYAMSVGNDSGGTGCFVAVWDDGGTPPNIYVEYNTHPDWWLAQVHVDIGTAHDSLAHNKPGNLQPGKFRFPPKEEFNLDPYVQQHVVMCDAQSSWYAGTSPWTDGDPGYDPTKGLLICAHSIVCQREWDEINQKWIYVNCQTGTGADSTPEEPGKRAVVLPDYCIGMERIAYPFTDSNTYWQIGLSGITGDPYDPYSVWNDDQWKGWCVERPLGLPSGYVFQVKLVDSRTLTAASNPRLWQNGNWPQVNWLLNNVGPGTDYENPPYDYVKLQNVIHALLGQYGLPPLNGDPYRQQQWDLYNEAMMHPVYEVPSGGWVAAVGEFCPDQDPPGIDTDTIQTVFVVVDP